MQGRKPKAGFKAQPVITYDEIDVRGLSEQVPWTHKFHGIDKVHELGVYGEGVLVGVIDTGVKSNHPDLMDAIVIEKNFVSDERLSSYGNHGTGVIGVFGSRVNKTGIIGNAPKCQIASYKALKANGVGNFQDVLKAFKEARRDGCHIIVSSIGSEKFYKRIADEIELGYSSGIWYVAAAGNDGERLGVDFPAKHPKVIAAGSISNDGNLSAFSDTSPEPFFLAGGDKILTLSSNGKTQFQGGTSFSAPFIGGCLALLISAKVNFSFRTLKSYGKLTTILDDSGTGYFTMIDTYKMIKELGRDIVPIKEEPEEPSDCNDKEKATQNLIQSFLSLLKTWFT